MKTMKVQLVTGHMVEIEDINLSHCTCFAFAGDGRIIGLGRDADDNNVICVWREVKGEYSHHATISLRNSGHDDCLMTITATTRMHMKMNQPPVCNDMDLIIIG